MVTREQFETLLSEDIFKTLENDGASDAITWSQRKLGVPETTKAGPYSDYVSWAVWKKESAGQGPQAASNDMSVLASYEILEDKIHTDVILLALNKGMNPTSLSTAPWANFHSGSRDYNLARALEDTPLSGAYITDLYKGLPTKSAAELNKFMDGLSSPDRARINEAMRRIFEREMEIIGASMNVPIICLGDDTLKYFNEIFRGTREPVFANHYSRAMSREFYSDQMNEIASNIF